MESDCSSCAACNHFTLMLLLSTTGCSQRYTNGCFIIMFMFETDVDLKPRYATTDAIQTSYTATLSLGFHFYKMSLRIFLKVRCAWGPQQQVSTKDVSYYRNKTFPLKRTQKSICEKFPNIRKHTYRKHILKMLLHLNFIANCTMFIRLGSLSKLQTLQLL